ncbi:hypothetical protein [Dactylosporangium cerinum]
MEPRPGLRHHLVVRRFGGPVAGRRRARREPRGAVVAGTAAGERHRHGEREPRHHRGHERPGAEPVPVRPPHDGVEVHGRRRQRRVELAQGIGQLVHGDSS